MKDGHRGHEQAAGGSGNGTGGNRPAAGGTGHRIAVISDTHNLLRPEVVEIIKTCDAVLHGGDISGPETLEKIRRACGSSASFMAGGAGNFFAVRGNNDRDWAADLPYELEVQLYGRKFFMTHKKKDIPADVDADVVIYGHSHKYAQTYIDGILYLNPGSCGPRRFNQPITMAVLTIPEAGAIPGAESGYGDSAGTQGKSGAGDFAGTEGKSGVGELIGTEGKSGVGDFAGTEGERRKSYGITVEKIEIAHGTSKTAAGTTVSTKQQVSADLIRKIGADLEKHRTVSDIAARRGVSRELADQIVRLYVTHPGVTAEQIMSKMGL